MVALKNLSNIDYIILGLLQQEHTKQTSFDLFVMTQILIMNIEPQNFGAGRAFTDNLVYLLILEMRQ